MTELETTLCLHESFVIMQIISPFKMRYLPTKINSVFSKIPNGFHSENELIY